MSLQQDEGKGLALLLRTTGGAQEVVLGSADLHFPGPGASAG